ncbi:class I SAM-dependent methyltransferase [Terribacillus sp. 179-K 1B1 HS]|uniref:class I SAM-dependent methyltransferase n=1 Tax=Terribacillus sp. 179-K 1B1 HS TaxID=3142388 RepID=UPI0039A0EA4D
MEFSQLQMKRQAYNTSQYHKKTIEKSLRMKFLIGAAKTFGIRKTPLFQLLVFSKIKNYIRFMTLRQIYMNFDPVSSMHGLAMHADIFQSFMALASNLDLVSQHEDGSYTLNESYLLEREEAQKLLDFYDGHHSKSVSLLHKDYLFIENTISADPKSGLGKIMHTKDMQYVREVLIYLRELNGLNFYYKVHPSFSEEFYTNLGELAFHTYTKDNFKRFLLDKEFESVLDIGCGNGNYIDVYREYSKQIIGVERQEKVYEKLKLKYKSDADIALYNDDILDIHFDQQFDMINMSYMLFYLTYEQKLDLFYKLKQILHKNGCIVICQYYPDFEINQELIARHNKKWNLLSRYKFDICNSILQGEVLLNNMLADFAQAERWDIFLTLLDSCGFQVSAITPADDTYYSYFITITHKNGG